MTGKNKSELVKQIEAYGLKGKLADLAHKEAGTQTIPTPAQAVLQGHPDRQHSHRAQETHGHQIRVRDSRHAGGPGTAR